MAIKRQSTKGYLYIIAGGKDIYKIGVTKSSPARRLAQLQTGNDRKLEIVKTYYRNDYKELERRLHRQFKHCRGNGEWFYIELDKIVHAIEGNTLMNSIGRVMASIWFALQLLVVFMFIVVFVDIYFNNSQLLMSFFY